VNRWRDPS